ncbi:unnamed protein product, partial [Ectocarpus sp. 13 AM-2016]
MLDRDEVRRKAWLLLLGEPVLSRRVFGRFARQQRLRGEFFGVSFSTNSCRFYGLLSRFRVLPWRRIRLDFKGFVSRGVINAMPPTHPNSCTEDSTRLCETVMTLPAPFPHGHDAARSFEISLVCCYTLSL